MLFFLSLSLSAQTPDTATVRGRVLDQTNSAVPGVDITLTNNLTGLQKATQSDSSGNFSVAGLPVAGSYNIEARKQGFSDAKLENVQVVGGSTAELNLQLNAAGGKTEITVT
ncbi:MAG: carboxypeptidase-like regulatory domain-containing protein, partial [Bdellovibrionota bacterium]